MGGLGWTVQGLGWVRIEYERLGEEQEYSKVGPRSKLIDVFHAFTEDYNLYVFQLQHDTFTFSVAIMPTNFMSGIPAFIPSRLFSW